MTNRVNKMLIHTVLRAANDAGSHKDRVKILKDNQTKALVGILRGSYDKGLVFDLPTGLPEGLKLNADHDFITIEKHVAKFPHLLKTASIRTSRKEELFVDIVATIHPDEVDMVVRMKDKTIRELFPKITIRTINAAFDNIIR